MRSVVIAAGVALLVALFATPGAIRVAMATRTVFLLPVMGLLYVIITMSVVIQRLSYKATGRRVFRMSPLHHHFELAGWSEVTIVIRFWIIAGVGVVIALGLFFGDFLRTVG